MENPTARKEDMAQEDKEQTNYREKGENPEGKSHAGLELEHTSSELCFKIQSLYLSGSLAFCFELLASLALIRIFYTQRSTINN